jgi:hypothetical protein
MRKLLFISLCLSGLIISGCDKEHNPFFKKGNPFASLPPSVILKDTTSVSFAETEFRFGKINEGDKVEHIFKVQNTGNKPLIIANAWDHADAQSPSIRKSP